MPIDFFKDCCKSNSNKAKFGLCDDPTPSENPAYIDEDNSDNWIGVVKNKNEHSLDFFAIDHCVDIIRPDGKMESRCDGLLRHEKRLIFVELKSRKKKGSAWLTEGRRQLKATIEVFKDNIDKELYESIEGYVCNQLKPLANQGHAVQLQKFKDETGYSLKAKQIIDI